MNGELQQALLCQLLKTDVEAIVGASIALKLSDPNDPSVTSSAKAFLTSLHYFKLVSNLFVRVSIPEKKRGPLLEENKYYKLWKEANPPSSSPAPNEREEGPCRAGRVVALTPKPDASGPSLADWLIAVQLGEKIEVLPVRCVSDRPIREEEFLIYCRSLSDNRNTSSKDTVDSPELESLIHLLAELRSITKMVLENDGEASRKRLDAASHPTHPHKRPREDDATTHRPDSADDPLQSLFPSPLQRLQDRLTTLQSVLDRKEASIRQLQQLVQRREEELSQQAQQLETTRAEEEVRRGRQQAKMGDLAQANKTLSADLASKTQELEDTKEKMAKLARKALEFRSVVVACGRYLGLTDNNNAVPDVEEVLKKLREGTKQ